MPRPCPPEVKPDNYCHNISILGDDFDGSSITMTLQGELHSVEDTAYVNIIDDDVSEYEEVFLLVLRVVNATNKIQIDMGRNVSVVRIRQDCDG